MTQFIRRLRIIAHIFKTPVIGVEIPPSATHAIAVRNALLFGLR